MSGTAVEFDTGTLTIRGDRWEGDDPAKPEVLFLHGGGQTRHAWGGSAAALAAAGWTSTTLDLRGHGDSDWAPDGQYRLSDHVADLRAVLTHLGPRVVLVGASLGGLTALTLQGEDGAAGGGGIALVLVDIVPRTHPEGVARIQAFMTGHLDGFASLEEVADSVAEYTRRPRRSNLEGLRKNVRLHDDGRWYWHWDPRMMTAQPNDEPRPGTQPELVLAVARKVQVPVLVVRGKLSDVVDDQGIEEFLGAVPTAHVVDVAGAGHMVAGDDNDRFTDAVRTFLDAL